MIRLLQMGLSYGLFAACVVYLSQQPNYRLLAPGNAIISLTFSHAGKRVGECRSLSQEELNALPPNMRKPNDCPRERHPVFVQLLANDKLLIERLLAPSGIWSDGKANVYERITVAAGDYRIRVGMNDSGSGTGFNYEKSSAIRIVPGQNLVISFDESSNAFTIE